MNSIDYIDTTEKLTILCQKIQNMPWVAVDTEFLREKTYYPKFCLLQIATTEWVACVDPLVLPSLDMLFEVLSSPSIIKVFHSCRQDQEIFFLLTGKLLEPIFDTQLAAPLLGFQENPGYGMLVSGLLNINLTKAHTRTDWSLRPLSGEQLRYAADDVIYLGKIYELIQQKLTEFGRADWLQDDFAQFTNPEFYSSPPEKAWLRIKGKNKLTGKQLSVLQVLAEWREKTAKTENRPRNWLLRDDLILELTKLQPTHVNEFANIRMINERTIKRYGHELCRLIREGKLRPPVKLDEKARMPKKSQQQEAILDILTAVVRVRADENSLNPAILASRKDLEKLLFEFTDCKLLHGWRYTMVGQELAALLQGKLALSIASGKIAIEENL
jgi:ribonuclease D